MKALFLDTTAPYVAAGLRAALPPDFELLQLPSAEREDLVRLGADIELLVGFRSPIDGELLRAVPHARLLQQIGAGYDNVDVPSVAAAGVLIANTPGANSGAVAEHIVMLMLVLLKRFVYLENHTR